MEISLNKARSVKGEHVTALDVRLEEINGMPAVKSPIVPLNDQVKNESKNFWLKGSRISGRSLKH